MKYTWGTTPRGTEPNRTGAPNRTGGTGTGAPGTEPNRTKPDSSCLFQFFFLGGARDHFFILVRNICYAGGWVSGFWLRNGNMPPLPSHSLTYLAGPGHARKKSKIQDVGPDGTNGLQIFFKKQNFKMSALTEQTLHKSFQTKVKNSRCRL